MKTKFIRVDDTRGNDVYININHILGFTRFENQDYTVIYTLGNSRDAPYKFYTSCTPAELDELIIFQTRTSEI